MAKAKRPRTPSDDLADAFKAKIYAGIDKPEPQIEGFADPKTSVLVPSARVSKSTKRKFKDILKG